MMCATIRERGGKDEFLAIKYDDRRNIFHEYSSMQYIWIFAWLRSFFLFFLYFPQSRSVLCSIRGIKISPQVWFKGS